MRVTQTMLANSSLRHMSNNFTNLAKIQDQLATGKKISRASQDPVVAMNGMRYRTQVTEVEQFKRNLGEVYNWMDTADATLDEVTQTLQRIRELTVQASNDTYEQTQRGNVAKEITQLKEHLVSLGNTRSNNKYIFNGTNTTNAPINTDKMDLAVGDLVLPTDGSNYELTYNGELYKYDTGNVFKSSTGKAIELNSGTIIHSYPSKDIDGNNITETKNLKETEIVASRFDAISTNKQNVEIEVLKGVNIAVNISPSNVFSNDLFGDIQRLEKILTDSSTKPEDITKFLDNIDVQIDKTVNERAELGARYNRVEMIENRVLEQDVIAQRILSDNEDADMEKVIIDLTSQEAVHRAALATGARIIQPSLMDFLR